MHTARSISRAPRRRGSGGTLLEYALGIFVVALSAMAATQLLGCRVNQAFANVTHTMSKAF